MARERVQVERLDGDERLALAGLHLGDVALVEDDAAHQLDVEEADVHRALERLAHGRVASKRRSSSVSPFSSRCLELGGLAAQLVVGERLELGLERADVGGLAL